MRKIILGFAVVAFFATQTLVAQENNDNAKVDVKIEKKIATKDGEQNMSTKIVISKDGKVIAQEEGKNIRLKDVLSKAGLSRDDVNNMSINIDSDMIGQARGGHRMMWMNDGEDMEFTFNGDDMMMFRNMHGNKMMHKGKHGKKGKNMQIHRGMSNPMMMFDGGKVSIYDFSKSDKDTKGFNAKQKKEIDFKSTVVFQ